jgi:hypothetical protein
VPRVGPKQTYKETYSECCGKGAKVPRMGTALERARQREWEGLPRVGPPGGRRIVSVGVRVDCVH